ncbi:vitamin K epoxide reductase family protein [Chryseobacterium sp. CT-SW4]|uniref:vitamin K epoxide reductase family protein n=1 Tax=Chryseobacterium sp. SW-1 TaxID=3157343 RepID=UPI003B027D32
MILDKLIHHLKLDKQEFLFQFSSHPHYPSALAFSDTLNFMGVKNDAYELEKQYWDELPEEFIAIVDNAFSLVKKTGKQYAVYSDTIKTISKQQLYHQSTNFILLFEKTENTITAGSFSNFKSLVYIILGLILLYSFMNIKWFESVFNLLSLTGFYISMEIFSQKFGNNSSIIKNICGQGSDSSTFSQENSCNKIITQDSTRILGLKFADLSFIYFTGLIILGLFFPSTSLLIKGLTFTSLIAICYSLYIQGFVEKTFCRVCLLIITVLFAQLMISFLLFENLFINGKIILLGIILYLIIFSCISYTNSLLKERETLQKSNAKNLRFKRNYNLFKRELLDHEKINFTDSQTLSVGNPEYRLRISIISNPYCGFCKDAHAVLENLLKKYPGEISAQIRFNYFPERTNEKLTQLLSDFMYIHENKTESDFLNAIEMWYENRNEAEIHSLAGNEHSMENLASLAEMSKENAAAGLNFTPVFLINGYPFPEKYDREDIVYFIDELLEDEYI